MGTATQMQAYHYKTGDRPLEGYTVQRGVGRGAFGEVYYALSDSGREVALKSILGYEQIELRGVSQCMNLKSPYLVSIFDIRRNQEGRNFVIMEYVAGPSLRELLDDSPSGLGSQKTAFFLREIAKGLTYLHDRGIVHRDLKPGNIFYEDGYVKIGDYGLSKAITPSQHSGQTITVGTVHYMAPEIGKGCYDKSIDVYALGVLVFEMLTGHVPFFGSSHGEILMKHLVEEPDVAELEEPFATVVRKAMAKNPADRYQSVQEMVEAVFGAEHINQSVSVFRPESLSIVAERAARKLVGTGEPGSSAKLPDSLREDPPAGDSSDIWLDFGRKMEQVTNRFQKATGELVTRTTLAADRIARRPTAGPAVPPAESDPGESAKDPMTRRQRRLLAVATAGVVGFGTAFLADLRADPVIVAIFVGLAILGGSSGLVWADRRLLPRHEGEKDFSRRFIIALPGFVGMLAVSVFLLAGGPVGSDHALISTYFAAGLTLLIVRWDKLMSPNRRERVILGQAVLAGLVAFALSMVFDGIDMLAMGIMAGTGLVTQIASPFTRRSVAPEVSDERTEPIARHRWSARPPALPNAAGHSPRAAQTFAGPGGVARSGSKGPLVHVPAGFRVFWLLVFMATAGVGLFCTIALGFAPARDFAPFLGGSLGCGMGAVFSLIQLRRRSCFGWWGNLVKPFLMMAGLGTAIGSTIALTDARPGSDEALILAFFAGVSAALFLGLLLIPNDLFGRRTESRAGSTTAAKSGALVAASIPAGFKVFWLLMFVATLGVGLFCTMALSVARHEDFAPFLGGSVGCGMGVIFSLIQLRRRTCFGWWGDFVKPFLMMAGLGIAVGALIALGDARSGSDEALILAFLTGFPIAVFLGMLLVPNDLFGRRTVPRSRPAPTTAGRSPRDWTAALVLTCLGFAGPFGLQRFYVGKIGTGLLWLCTFGLLGLGQIFDLIMICTGEFTDAHGRKLRTEDQPPPATMEASPRQQVGWPASVPAATPVNESVEAESPATAEPPQARPEPAEPVRREPTSSVPRLIREPRRTSLALSALACAVLVPGMLVGAAAAMQVPSFIAIGFPSEELRDGLDELFGYSGWPGLATRLGFILSIALLVFSALLLVVARRQAGGAHIVRALVGLGLLLGAGAFWHEAFSHLRWANLVAEASNARRLEIVLDSLPEEAGAAVVALIAAGVILLWPERRRIVRVDSIGEGVAA